MNVEHKRIRVMNTNANYTKQVAETIWQQILCTTDRNVVWSWGVSTRYFLTHKNMPSLAIKVQGFLHKGFVIISLDEGMDLYNLYLCKTLKGKDNPTKVIEGLYFDQLGEVIDRYVERGDCSDKEYAKKVDNAKYKI